MIDLRVVRRINMLIVFTFMLVSHSAMSQENDCFKPGEVWLDSELQPINAHGGGIIYSANKYYWFGEHKVSGRKGNSAMVGVRCYSSDDLYNWKNEGVALEISSDPESEITQGCVIERPKVIYNQLTDKYVMWFHLELKHQGYSAARTGVAISDNVSGPYKYLKSYRPNANTWPLNYTGEKVSSDKVGEYKWWTPKFYKAIEEGLFVKKDFEKGQMSRDMTLFVDDDGKAYHIHSSEENLTLHISELSDDYISFTSNWIRVLPGGHNEAPTMFKYKKKYYMITSGCTGWKPNEARLLVSDSILGEWSYVGNPAIGEGSEITFNSQSTFVLPLEGKNDSFIFMADRWNPENPIDGRYVWLPVKFNNDIPYVSFEKKWKLLELFYSKQ